MMEIEETMTKKIVIALGALAILVGAGAWAHGRAGRFNMEQMISNRVAAMEKLVQANPEQGCYPKMRWLRKGHEKRQQLPAFVPLPGGRQPRPK